ncbi:DNA mismatch repair protein MutT [Novosphingobium barchaimii LL02]|uniref:DNA mismatch repair protein MutT n=1 Tax=Novosphingobium barchaimii LL02 TaxID=1114963 RepID=A0A0J8AJH9_9SPHN|nr:DNA mismatch repair protein MutT [Novosphingobium barchaimii]KMS54850.1 DNA mismatch repair protein MutT [Novosphingobium barchaimii LL02]
MMNFKRLSPAVLLMASAACTHAPGAVASVPAAPVAEDAAAQRGYDLAAQKDKLATIPMEVDSGFLSAEERDVVNLLIKASDLMSEIYLRQRYEQNPQVQRAVSMNRRADRDLLVEMFARNFGPWDELADLHPFWGTAPMPEGAGFYPVDLTRADLEAYVAAHPDQKAALLSPYTVVRRQGAKLIAVPYSVEYRQWLEPASRLLEQAAARTSNPSLKTFLGLRAKAFLSDDYYESELAWMDLTGTPIEVAIGPYEVYTDRLMGAKTSFESFVTLKDPEQSAALAKYKKYLKDMEANLPIEDKYKNFQRGFESPIAVAEQVRGGGDNVPGPQTIAFNLPNDERVREAKGAKKVILSNVLGAKFDRTLQPMAALVLKADQARYVAKDYMQYETLFHELSHSLGPGSIVVNGEKTTVDKALKEQNSALEEAKADVAGVWNILLMMQKGELPVAERPQLFATYFTGIFRAVRFGAVEAHGKGAALQYAYLRAHGAFAYDAAAKRYVVDNVKMEAGLKALLHDMLMLQATGDYEGTKAFMAKWAKLDAEAAAAIAGMAALPVDIRPVYPDTL